jgi:hypothetical protein
MFSITVKIEDICSFCMLERNIFQKEQMQLFRNEQGHKQQGEMI